MADIIHEHTTSDSSGSGMAVGVLISILVILLFYFLVLPQIRGAKSDNPSTINVQVTPNPTTPSNNPSGSNSY